MHSFDGNDLAKKILERIKPFTCFPAILLETQARKIGKDLKALRKTDLIQLADSIEKAVAAFGNPEKGREAREKILQI